MNIDDVSMLLADMVERGRRGAITNADMSGGTFTVTNVGMYGVEAFTPIINYPQSAILGVGTIARLPRYPDNQSETPVPRYIMKICLSYDHRVIDGAPAARFAARIRELLQNIKDENGEAYCLLINQG
jgi:pyruvate dehydrogenase E2 component (dihydrolipoamide acetyltransferase)